MLHRWCPPYTSADAPQNARYGLPPASSATGRSTGWSRFAPAFSRQCGASAGNGTASIDAPLQLKCCRFGVPAIPWHWHQRLAHTDVRSPPPFSDRRRRPIAARGGGARLPAPVGQWGGQRRGYRSNTYRGPLQAAGRGLEAHGASSVGARPGGSRSPGGGVLRGHIRAHNTTIGLIPRPPRPWTPPTHPRGHAGRLDHRTGRLQRPCTPRSFFVCIGRFSQKSHPRGPTMRRTP